MYRKLKGLFYTTLFLFISFIITFIVLNTIFPLTHPYRNTKFAKVVLDRDGRPLRYFADNSGVWRYRVNIDEVPKKYIEALLGYEDRFFYQHPGINPFAIARAFFLNMKHKRIVSGGSTITMQVARLVDPHKKSISGKIKQIFRSIQLETYYTKNEILEFYFNLAPYGGNIEGAQTASYYYFNRDIKDINHSEAALLAVLPQSPSRLRPDRYPHRAVTAKNKVAIRLLELGYWSRETVDTVLLDTMYITDFNNPMLAPIFSEYLISKYSGDRINTYIDRRLQIFIEDMLKRKKYILPEGVSAAIVVLDNSKGEILAYAGSIDYTDNSRSGYVNMAAALRSPGSTLKPFIYGLAIDKGLIHSKSMLLDAPRIYSKYKAGNFYQNFSGPVAADDALRRSLNVPFVQLLEFLTPEYFYTSLLNAGVKIKIPGGIANLSIALGGGGMSLTDITKLYSSLANKGLTKELLYVKGSNIDNTDRYLLSEEAAYIVYDTLRSQYRTDHIYSLYHTGISNKMAWKTGTSYGLRDSLSLGVTKNYTVGVWVGKPDNSPVHGHYGASTALPLLFEIGNYLEDDYESIEKPENILEKSICWPSGKASDEVSENDCHVSFLASTISGATPVTLSESPDQLSLPYMVTWQENINGLRANMSCKTDLLITKQAHVWPRMLEPWIEKRYRRISIFPPWDKLCYPSRSYTTGQIAITGVIPESTLEQPIDGKGIMISLTAVGALSPLSWYLNGELIADNVIYPKIHKITSKGKHELIALDDEGNMDKVDFYID